MKVTPFFVHLRRLTHIEMLVKRKIYLGFVVLGFILLLSSVIAIFEFVSMRKSVSKLVTDNIASINTSRMLLEVADEYNFKLLEGIRADSLAVLPEIPNIQKDKRFVSFLSEVRGKFTTREEKAMTDSVKYAYVAYAHIIIEAPQIWQTGYQQRGDWYFGKLYPVYMQLRIYIGHLSSLSQRALVENSKNLSEGFYRSVMPCVVAVAIGIILLLLFNYYLNFYFINPLERITKGIKHYRQTRKSYTVNLESDDEMQELNDNVKDIIIENKQLTKKNNSIL